MKKLLLILPIVVSTGFAGEYIVGVKDGPMLPMAAKEHLSSSQIVVETDNPDRLRRMSQVRYVETNRVYRLPENEKVESSKEIDKSYPQPEMRVIWRSAGWEIYGKTNDVLVAVSDTGIDTDHQDLNVASHAGVPGYDGDQNGWNFVGDNADLTDHHGHGTHVSGTIAAKDDGKGTTGALPGHPILMLKIFGSGTGAKLSDILEMFHYAGEAGVDVLNASWGGGGRSKSMYEAIKSFGAKGGILVAAAGNNGRNVDEEPMYPAGYELSNIVSVGAVDDKGKIQRPYWSNYGDSVDIKAPGVNIWSSIPGGYQQMRGTSMATPHVAGALALIWNGDEDFSDVKARERLMEHHAWEIGNKTRLTPMLILGKKAGPPEEGGSEERREAEEER